MEGTIDRQIRQLIDLVETKYMSTNRNHRPVDFALISQYFTLDAVSDLAFGQAFGYMERNDDLRLTTHDPMKLCEEEGG
jgi:hypothetical protein